MSLVCHILQSTLYEVARAVLKVVSEISSVELHMPILHHFPADLNKVGMPSTNNVRMEI